MEKEAAGLSRRFGKAVLPARSGWTLLRQGCRAASAVPILSLHTWEFLPSANNSNRTTHGASWKYVSQLISAVLGILKSAWNGSKTNIPTIMMRNR